MAENRQAQLRDTAAEFSRTRGALQSAGALATVAASPIARARLAALNKRAAVIQQAIEHVGRVIDGGRRWFADTFGADVSDAVPLADPAIDASVQTSIAAMNYFLRDAKAELDRISKRQAFYDTIPADRKDKALSELRAETTPADAKSTVSRKWVLIGAGVVALLVLMKGRGYESET